MSDDGLPVLPYNGGTSSGWSGSDTSRERAERADRSRVTGKRQKQILTYLGRFGSVGGTYKEVGDSIGVGHGTSSGALSALHMAGKVARLTTIRQHCKVYVLPEYVEGRETEPQGRCKHRQARTPVRDEVGKVIGQVLLDLDEEGVAVTMTFDGFTLVADRVALS